MEKLKLYEAGVSFPLCFLGEEKTRPDESLGAEAQTPLMMADDGGELPEDITLKWYMHCHM